MKSSLFFFASEVAPSGRERIASDSFAQRPRFRPNRKCPQTNQNYRPQEDNRNQHQRNPLYQSPHSTSSNTQATSVSENNQPILSQNNSCKSKNNLAHDGKRK